MEGSALVRSILRRDSHRWHLLNVVHTLDLPDCWIAAGFVRNAVWDHLHGRALSPLTTDVDVIWYDPGNANPDVDRKLEAALRVLEPSVVWSVKNQARMHSRNGDAPYSSAVDAMRFWPETATAIAARWDGIESCEVAAPYGLDDLLNLTLRPTPSFIQERRGIYEQRVQSKGWVNTWPRLLVVREAGDVYRSRG